MQNETDLLTGRASIASYLEMMPFCVRANGRMVARLTAVVNHRYNQHWKERLGHLIHFEALPKYQIAVCGMLNAAAGWLQQRGMTAIRSGFAAFLDYPYAIDNYGSLPPFLLRGNPDYYHGYFKSAGFFTEKGMIDFTVPLSADVLSSYPAMIEGVSQHGVKIQSWREYGYVAAVDAWTDLTNSAFAQHWGWNPITRQEVRPMLLPLGATDVADISTIAAADGIPAGCVFSVPDFSPSLAEIRHGARLDPSRGGGTRGALINIGVLKEWRGKGVNLALAARSFLSMAKMGMKFAGYTLVLDDNWPSRGTAQKLGGAITGNFVCYRRELSH